jgi:hypothetical protein
VSRRSCKPWTPDDIARLISMAEAGASWDAIGEALSRGPFGCQAKWRDLRPAEERARSRVAKLAEMRKGSTMAAPRAVRRDSRDSEIFVARQAPPRPPAMPPQSLTAAVLGDPVPGRSALDQRMRTSGGNSSRKWLNSRSAAGVLIAHAHLGVRRTDYLKSFGWNLTCNTPGS